MAKRKTKKQCPAKGSRSSGFFRAVKFGFWAFCITLAVIGAVGTWLLTPQLRTDHLAYGKPARADQVVQREGYVLGYSKKDAQPYWVLYQLTAENLRKKRVPRTNDFRPDPEISGGSATPEDYRATGYDRGHLAPAADMAHSEKTMHDSFYMSNMSPQVPAFNRGIWKDLESQVRSFALTEKDIYVVTGPVLPPEPGRCIGKTKRITVPELYYKVVYDRTPPEKMIGFILPNKGSNENLQSFAVSVDAVEKVTGLDFFSELPAEKQDKLEGSYSVSDWKWLDFTKGKK